MSKLDCGAGPLQIRLSTWFGMVAVIAVICCSLRIASRGDHGDGPHTFSFYMAVQR